MRQRRARAFAGQVSAVATVLGLLLVTTFLANFVLIQLPNEMQQREFDHALQVENQLTQLQATVLGQAAGPSVPLTVLSPITLGSEAVPPFAPATTSSISPETSSATSTFGYTVANLVQSPPAWNISPTCPPTGSPCNQGTNWDNVTGVPFNSYKFKFNGGAPTMILNFTGNNDSISLQWLGKSVWVVYLIFNGSNLHVSLIKGSNGGTTDTPRVYAAFYGQHDVFEVGFNDHNLIMNTRFFGSGVTCPAGNLSNTDRFYWNSTSSGNESINVTWYNNAGYSSGPTTYSFVTGSVLTFRNVTAFALGCAWDVAYPEIYSSPFLSGIRVHLNDRYSPAADLVYDQGAVLLSHPGLGSIMIHPPLVSFSRNASGAWQGTFTFVNTLANFSAEEGIQTTGVASRLISVDHLVVYNSPNHRTFIGGVWLNFTTPYPYAWSSFFSTFPTGTVLGGVSCTAPHPIPPPDSCLVPPEGTSVQLSVPLNLVQLTLTVVTVQLTIS